MPAELTQIHPVNFKQPGCGKTSTHATDRLKNHSKNEEIQVIVGNFPVISWNLVKAKPLNQSVQLHPGGG